MPFYHSGTHKSVHVKKEDSFLNHLNNGYGALYEDNKIDAFCLITKDGSVYHTYFALRTKNRTSHITVSFCKGLCNMKFCST